MEKLQQYVTGHDVFSNENTIDESVIQEYYVRNERKKEDDKWLKDMKPVIFNGMRQLGKNKADFGQVRVSYSVPDQSHFDEEKVLAYALEKGLFEMVTKPALDEQALIRMIEQGLIDFDELKEVAWVEKFGTERITVKKVNVDE
ncbi:hypothetical protein ACPA0F_18445 [Solibacillus silvestris]